MSHLSTLPTPYSLLTSVSLSVSQSLPHSLTPSLPPSLPHSLPFSPYSLKASPSHSHFRARVTTETIWIYRLKEASKFKKYDLILMVILT